MTPTEAKQEADDAYEDELEELLDFVSGKGKYRGLGKGAISVPSTHPDDAETHAKLAELERRGLVRRAKDADGFVWRATGFRIVRED